MSCLKTGAYTQGQHGGEIYKAAARLGLQARQLLDFSSNANIFALPVTEKIVNSLPYPFLHYPESDSAPLKEAIARHEDCQPENVLCGNGAADLIWQFLRHARPSSALLLGPAFSEYARACEALGIPFSIITPKPENAFACAEEELRLLWEGRAELTIICTPNNPAGVTYENMAAILRVLRSPRLLIDLSYREFNYDTPLYAPNSWAQYQKLINPGTAAFCLHSFTKFFCCPGIRLGYLLGDARNIQKMQAQQPSWSVTAFAQQSGLRFMESIKDYRASLAELRLTAYRLGAELRRLPIFNPDLVFEGPNFFCCGLAKNSPGALRRNDGRPIRTEDLQGFLLQHRLLARNCDNIPGMPAGFVRLQTRQSEDNQKLLDILQKA